MKITADANKIKAGDPEEKDMAPDSEDGTVRSPRNMYTADMAMLEERIYLEITKCFHENY